MKELGNKHFDEDFVLNGKKGNGTELDNNGDRGIIEKEKHHTKSKRD